MDNNLCERGSWQTDAIEQLNQLFKAEPDARAFILAGSLADPQIVADFWSDVDVKIILTDQAVERYYQSAAWLHPFGQLIGLERHEDQYSKTLRVCLDGYKRFDLVFVPESALQNSSACEHHLFHPPSTVFWSRWAGLKPDLQLENNQKHGPRSASRPSPGVFQGISGAELEQIADHFWLKASVAIAKVVRNDLLIGLHLALDLVRDCLELQMIRRDCVMGTHIHRIGSWGNELAARFDWVGQEYSAEKILDLIARSGDTFDELAVKLSSRYRQRGQLLSATISRARAVCSRKKVEADENSDWLNPDAL